MAHQFDRTFTIVAGSLQSASGWQKYVGWILLGHGQSGNAHIIKSIFFLCVKHTTQSRQLKVFGTTELPEKPIMLPPFVDSTHCLPYHLTRKGRSVADRVVTVLAYACPDITYSPSLYPITALLLHFMSGKYLIDTFFKV